jgi:hypothetical protein
LLASSAIGRFLTGSADIGFVNLGERVGKLSYFAGNLSPSAVFLPIVWATGITSNSLPHQAHGRIFFLYVLSCKDFFCNSVCICMLVLFLNPCFIRQCVWEKLKIDLLTGNADLKFRFSEKG